MDAVALPRLRVRFKRPQPPSLRTLYQLLTLALCLGFLATGVWRIAQGRSPVFNLILAIAWSFNYSVHRRVLRSVRQIEHHGTLPPPARWEWCWLALGVLVLAWNWT